MAGTYPRILPVDPRVAAFRAAVELLTKSPDCRPVRTWKVWTDSDDSAVEPTLDQCPCVRVTPLAGPAERKAGRGIGKPATYRCTVRLDVEVYVPGSRVDDLGNLWGRIEGALFGSTDEQRAAIVARLGACGVRDVELVRPALPQSTTDYGDVDVVGVGEVHLDVWFDL